VLLEPLSLDHVPGLVEIATGPRDSFRLTNVPADEASMRAWVAELVADCNAGTAVPFAVRDQRNGSIAGATRFMDIQYWAWPNGSPHQRGTDLPDALEIGGTWLAPWAQRSGINTEAKLLMLTHAFEIWRIHRVRLITDARNAKSRAAIERLGAKFEGILRSHQQAYDGAIRDSAFYSMLDSEWPTAKAALIQRLRTD
jgi:RimJ/RimL family protein N-acetyltransferase